LQCVAVCCSVLQCVAVCCSVLQCVAVCCSVLQCCNISDTHTQKSSQQPLHFTDLNRKLTFDASFSLSACAAYQRAWCECVCVCICVCVFGCVCMCVCMCVCVYGCVCVFVFIFRFVCAYFRVLCAAY